MKPWGPSVFIAGVGAATVQSLIINGANRSISPVPCLPQAGLHFGLGLYFDEVHWLVTRAVD